MIIKIQAKWANSPESHIHINDVDNAVMVGQYWRDDLHGHHALEKVDELLGNGSLTQEQADAIRQALAARGVAVGE